MRAKTVKRLAILIVAFVLVGGSAYAVWKFRVEKMARGVVEQADLALEKQNYIEAVDLYQQHLLVFPDDMTVQLKYADVALKLQHTPRHQQNAMGIYNEILRREPGRADVRRRAAELALAMPGGMFEIARGHLAILLKSAKDDGHLEFMMGRCYEEDKDPEKAATYFRAAIEHGSPERFEASQRLAALIRGNEKLGKPEDADAVIDAMVEADPKNYQVYLERGHYLSLFNLEGAEAAFQKSLELAPDQSQTYLELAQLVERNPLLEKAHQVLDPHRPLTFWLPTALDLAGQVLDDGLAKAPYSHLIYEARAEIERKAGRFNRFIEVLENGIKVAPQQTALHLHLAMILAAHGDTGKLLLEIEELKGLGVSRLFIDYLTAYYRFNNKEFESAKQILMSIQLGSAHNPDFKARVNVLLAQCYSQLREPEKEWDARQRAFNASPDDITVRVGWINGQISRLLSRGEIDEAIKEYQRLLSLTSQIDRKRLVNLMLMRNRQRPPEQRDWHEVEVQLDELAKVQPDSAEPVVLRALFYAEQDQPAKAWETLEAARSRFPHAVEPWTAEAELLVRQKKFEEALARLDSAQKQLVGDRFELRLARAAIWVGRNDRKDEEVVKVLKGLAKDLEPFAKEKRRSLLTYLAVELAAHQEVKAAEEIWLQLAQDPEDLNPHLQLFELALKTVNKAETDKKADAKAKADIETQIKGKAAAAIATQLKAIEKLDADIATQINAMTKAEADIATQLKLIEKLDYTYGRFYRARYLTWQAGRSRDDKDKDQRKKLRTEAHDLLTELKARRDEWEVIPVAEAALEDQELAEIEGDETRKREKQESIINLLLSAIELGSRNPDVVRRAVGLLFTTGRSNEAIQLFNRMAGSTPLGSELGLFVARVASAQNDQRTEETTRKATEMARKAVAANPGDFKERLWLVQTLLYGKHIAEAETELRRAVADAEADSERWRALIFFLIDIRQLPKAEQACRDAEKKLTQAPLTLAECCERMGQANEGPNTIAQAKKWYDEARHWFEAALAAAARKDPNDLSVLRRLVQFLLHTNPVEGEKQLQTILGPGAGAKDPATRAWARRTLALKYINTNPRRPAEALALYNTVGLQGTGADPEDRRVWTRVLLAQDTPEHRRAASECLESLVDEKLANPDDQQLLARLEEAAGDWPKSRDQYRKLVERMSSLSDPEGRKRRIVILTEFADRLLQSHQPSEDKDKDLAEAQELIDKLNQLQPHLTKTLNLEVTLHAARNNFEAAAALIRSTGERVDLNPVVLPPLAEMAEKIGRFDEFKLAEEIYRKIESAPGAPFNPNKVYLIKFLVRRGRVPEALDLCESIRKNATDRRQVDGLCLEIFGDPNIPASPEQVKRVIGWFVEEDRSNLQMMMYQIGLGNLYERLGQDQQAEDYYRAAIKSNDRDGVASNNLAWLMALRGGGKWQDALDLINHAIAIKGPIPDYLDTRGVVYLSANEGQRAIADLTAAINQAAFNGQPSGAKYFHLAQAYLAVHDSVNAKKSLEVAKTKGLPVGLHRLEMDKYQQMLDKLKN